MSTRIDARDPVALADAWCRRVEANREQDERIRVGPERADFYAPVSSHFVEDPRRNGDATLDALLELARPGETWLDIGAGAGRFALPLALVVGVVIAVEPSAAMVAGLRAGMAEHGIANVRVVQARWPLDSTTALLADVALIAHVGYDVAEIGEFLDAMEASARRLCVAVLMVGSPAATGDSFWPAVHGQERAALPSLPEFLELLRARGRSPEVTMVSRPNPALPEADLLRYLRQQLWTREGSEADGRLLTEVARRTTPADGGLVLDVGPGRIGIVRWTAEEPAR